MSVGVQAGEIVEGRYVVERLIGRGAMADVFAAQDRHSGAHVALKILHRALSDDAQAIERFRREAHVQGMMRHRNVARVYGGGMTSYKEPYLVLELLRGYSLRDVIKSAGRVDVVRGCSYIWQALQGLASAHSRGILHRDLKPANLMLEPSPGPVERVCLIDFGFASLEGGTKVTRQGEVVGSLSYMAPERLQGHAASERSDLYSLGIILYEILVGRRPFEGKTDYQLIDAHVTEPPVPPSRAAPDVGVPPAVEAVLMRSLSKDPAYRHQSALSMADDLEIAAQQA